MLFCIDLHYSTKLLIEFFLVENLKSWHFTNRVERPKVDELMGFSDGKELDILFKIFERFCFCLEYRTTSHRMIDITLSKHRVENIIARDFTSVNCDCVSDLETFPHGVIVKLFKKTWLRQLDLTKLP